MLFRVIFVVHSENHKEPINSSAHGGQNAEVCNAKAPVLVTIVL
jgi:hypothetical protein